ncbi:MAG: hypothetical protein HAW67_01460 [Endozoicomonadaceae bacterium]|nr:hypothetical protein [Endozoicomonadaceae bacterium]
MEKQNNYHYIIILLFVFGIGCAGLSVLTFTRPTLENLEQRDIRIQLARAIHNYKKIDARYKATITIGEMSQFKYIDKAFTLQLSSLTHCNNLNGIILTLNENGNTQISLSAETCRNMNPSVYHLTLTQEGKIMNEHYDDSN